MVRLLVTDRDGSERVVEAEGGQSIMTALRDNGISSILALCGGNLSCATCHIYLDPAAAPLFNTVSEDEDDLLDAAEFRQPESRLSCQLPLTDDMPDISLTVAPED